MRALHMAPMETARAVQVTVGGTAAMLGEAAGQMAAAARLAAADSAQRLAASSRKAKVGPCMRSPGHARGCAAQSLSAARAPPAGMPAVLPMHGSLQQPSVGHAGRGSNVIEKALLHRWSR